LAARESAVAVAAVAAADSFGTKVPASTVLAIATEVASTPLAAASSSIASGPTLTIAVLFAAGSERCWSTKPTETASVLTTHGAPHPRLAGLTALMTETQPALAATVAAEARGVRTATFVAIAPESIAELGLGSFTGKSAVGWSAVRSKLAAVAAFATGSWSAPGWSIFKPLSFIVCTAVVVDLVVATTEGLVAASEERSTADSTGTEPSFVGSKGQPGSCLATSRSQSCCRAGLWRIRDKLAGYCLTARTAAIPRLFNRLD